MTHFSSSPIVVYSIGDHIPTCLVYLLGSTRLALYAKCALSGQYKPVEIHPIKQRHYVRVGHYYGGY